VLQQLVAGGDRAIVVDAFAGVLAPDADALRRAGDAGRAALPDWLGLPYVTATVDWETLLCEHRANALPDFAGACVHLTGLAAVAEWLGDGKLAEQARKAADGWHEEAESQCAWQTFQDGDASRKDLDAFAKKHRGTRYGDAAR
jgi:hypothetical protein